MLRELAFIYQRDVKVEPPFFFYKEIYLFKETRCLRTTSRRKKKKKKKKKEEEEKEEEEADEQRVNEDNRVTRIGSACNYNS